MDLMEPLMDMEYLPHLDRLYDDAPVRKGDIEHVQQMANGYSH